MHLIRASCLLASFAAASCVTPVAEYRPPPRVEVERQCNPDYPCGGSYYFDEWREVYVYYDGYKYIDCTGLPGGYPLPPQGILYLAPPPGYVPPTAWVPPRGTYHPPVGFVPRGGPAPPLPPRQYGNQPTAPGRYGYDSSPTVNIPPPGYYGGQPGYGQAYLPQPGQAGYVGPQNPNQYGQSSRQYETVPPPPPNRGPMDPTQAARPSAYGAPPPPVQGQARPYENEPARGGYGAPPPQQGQARPYENEPARGGYAAPPPQGQARPYENEPARGGYVAPPPQQGQARPYENEPARGGYVAPPPAQQQVQANEQRRPEAERPAEVMRPPPEQAAPQQPASKKLPPPPPPAPVTHPVATPKAAPATH